MAYSPEIAITDLPAGLLEKAFPHAGELDLDPARIGLVPSIGFLAVKPEAGEATVTIKLLGVYTSSDPHPELPVERLVVPTELASIHPHYITADRIGKGVLGRFWNNEKASRGWIDDPQWRGIYAFDVDPLRLRYVTEPFSGGGKQAMDRINSHRAVRGHEKREGTPLAVEYQAIRNSYGDSQAIFMTEPPRPKLRRLARAAWGVPKNMGASFIAPLNRGAQAHRVGVIKR